jgi:hypothetical protein
MKPGHVERRGFEYVRHGTQALSAAFDVASGKVRGTIGDAAPKPILCRSWTICSPRCWRHAGTTSTPTCPKEWSVWSQSAAASMKTSGRRGSPASSCQRRHARRFCAMPVIRSRSTSRPSMPLDQPNRDLVLDPGSHAIRRGNFTSQEHVRQRTESFIAYFNATLAKPFRWTMKGKPLVAGEVQQQFGFPAGCISDLPMPAMLRSESGPLTGRRWVGCVVAEIGPEDYR